MRNDRLLSSINKAVRYHYEALKRLGVNYRDDILYNFSFHRKSALEQGMSKDSFVPEVSKEMRNLKKPRDIEVFF